MNTAKLLADFAYGLRASDLPEATLHNTRRFLLDYLSACLAGKKVNAIFNSAIERYVYTEGGANQASALFSDKKLPCGRAAFLNACYAHGADMDDGNRKAMGHVGAHVFSAVLAVGETLCSGELDMLVAANIGYEVYCRVAAAAQPGLVHRGFHSTGTAGVIACAASAAKLMGLDAEGIYNAMAISVTMASGLMIVAESGQSIKPLNPAKAAECGILAASLARDGVKGGDNPLESSKGWFHAMSDKIDCSMITDGLGQHFCVDESYMKPYPSCRHTHCGMQASLELRNENKLSSTDIKKVNIYIYPNAIKIAGQIKKPQTADDAKFSIHYATASILSLGRFTLNELDSRNMSSETERLINVIELIPDESMENRDAGIRGCRVELITADGRVFDKTVLIPKGDPQNAFSDEDMQNKLSQCADGLLSEEQQIHLTERIYTFGQDNKNYEGIKLF